MSIGLLLADDFLFISRIQGHARALGLDVQSVRTQEILLQRAADKKPTCVILDVHVAGLDVATLVPALKKQDPVPYIVAYGSHVEAATLAAARTAGCDLVLPKSRFVEELPTALPAWMTKRE